MRYVIRIILSLIILIGFPFVWAILYGLSGSEEATKIYKGVLHSVWYGEDGIPSRK